GDGADRARGGAGEQVLGRVRRIDDHVLACAESEPHEGVRKTTATLVVVVPCQAARLLDDGRHLGPGGGMGGDRIHWPALCSKNERRRIPKPVMTDARPSTPEVVPADAARRALSSFTDRARDEASPALRHLKPLIVIAAAAL